MICCFILKHCLAFFVFFLVVGIRIRWQVEATSVPDKSENLTSGGTGS